MAIFSVKGGTILANPVNRHQPYPKSPFFYFSYVGHPQMVGFWHWRIAPPYFVATSAISGFRQDDKFAEVGWERLHTHCSKPVAARRMLDQTWD